jgi:hypothetical protein
MASDFDLAPDWLNSNAAAFVPDNATWVTLEQFGSLTVQTADTETLPAMKIAAERDKDTLDIARLPRKLNIANAVKAVNLAYDKYGGHSIPLAVGRENYLLVVEDALDATAALGLNAGSPFPESNNRESQGSPTLTPKQLLKVARQALLPHTGTRYWPRVGPRVHNRGKRPARPGPAAVQP